MIHECACAWWGVAPRAWREMAADRMQIDEETGLPVYRTKAKDRYVPCIVGDEKIVIFE